MRARNTQNLEMLAVVAKGLKGLKEKVVFVGGATIDLYLLDPNVSEARPTDDVDCVVHLTRRTEYYNLEEELRALGFEHPMVERGPICRWKFSGIKVDVMPTEGKILGFSNRWYADGVARAETAELPDGQKIAIFPIPYLIASKVEAFLDRGRKDYLVSTDMEDILALIDGYPQVKERILAAPLDVKLFLAEKFGQFLLDSNFTDAIQGQIQDGPDGADRASRALAVLQEIAAASS